MAATLAQARVDNTSGTSTVSAALGSSPTAGNIIVVVVGANVTTSSVSMTTPASGWSTIEQAVTTTNSINIFARVVAGGEGSTYTATATGAGTMFIQIYEIQGAAATVAEAIPAANHSSTSSIASGTSAGTPSVVPSAGKHSYAIAGIWWGGGVTSGQTANSGFSIHVASSNRGASADRAISPAAGAYSTTFAWTTNRPSTTAIAIVEPSGLEVNVSDSVATTERVGVQIEGRSTVEGFFGYECGANGLEEGIVSGLNGAITSAQAYTGTYSIRVNPTTTNLGSFGLQNNGTDGALSPANGYNQANLYVETRFMYATKSTAATGEEIMAFINTGSGHKGSLRLNSNGTLAVYNASVTLVATGSTVLNADTWYLIGFMAGTGPSAPYEVRINKVTELSGYMNTGTLNHHTPRVGKNTDRNGTSVDYYFDDSVVDTTRFNDGIYRVRLARAAANGSPMQWTAGTGSDYTQINEVPLSGVNYLESTSANDVAMFVPQTTTQVGIPGARIIAVKSAMQLRENTSGTSGVKMRLVSGATTSDLSTRDTTTTPASYNQFFNTDPNAPTAGWTESAFNSVTFGAVETTSTVQRMTWAGLMVLYQSAEPVVSDAVATTEFTNVQIEGRSSILAMNGFESGTFVVEEVIGTNSTIVTSPTYAGTYALRINATGTGVGNPGMFGYGADGTPQASPGFLQSNLYTEFRFRYATKSSAATGEEIVAYRAVTGPTNNKAAVRLNSSGVLAVYDTNDTLVATGSTVLSANTWYLIGFMTGTGTSAPYELRINNVTELSGYCNTSTVVHNGPRVGKVNNRNSTDVDYYFDDVIIDSAQFSGGTLKIANAMPTANSSPMQWTGGTGASNYTQVNEVPVSTSSYVQSTTTNDVAMFVPQTTSQLGIAGAQIKAVKVIAGVRENASGTSGVKLRIVSGATTVDTTAKDTTTTEVYNAALFTSDPNAPTANWTESAFNAHTMGVVETTATAQRLVWISSVVAYELSQPSASESTSVNESVSVSIESAANGISVSDSVSSAESVAVSVSAPPDTDVSVSDSSSLSELVALELATSINASDSISITEQVSLDMPMSLSVSDSSSITESVNIVIPEYYIATSDSVSLAESVSVSVVAQSDFNINISDNTSLSESISQLVTSFMSVTDTVSTTESLGRELTSFISTSDSIAMAESVSLAIAVGSTALTGFFEFFE